MRLTFIFLLLLPLTLSASNLTNPILSRYWFRASKNSAMTEIAKRFEVTRRLNDGFEVLVPLSKSTQFLNLAEEAELLELDISAKLRNRTANELMGYHNLESVKIDLNKIKDSYPHLASLEEYGNSLEKRALLALRLSAPSTKGVKPSVLLTASTHGDELITVEVIFGLIDKLLSGYQKDPRLTRLLESYDLFFIPVVNPDGYFRFERYANGVDPNRDYPWIQDPNHKSNPCISSIMKFYEAHQIKASIDFHAYGEMIMYPWAYTYNPLPSFEESIFDEVTSQMASLNGYQHGQISKIIYVAQGSSADYYHWKHNAWSLGIEVGTSKAPPASQISKIIQENIEPTWTFLESIK